MFFGLGTEDVSDFSKDKEYSDTTPYTTLHLIIDLDHIGYVYSYPLHVFCLKSLIMFLVDCYLR